MPLRRYSNHNHHHRPHNNRDRSRLALLLSSPQQRKQLCLLIGGSLVYLYAFFHWQPDRSYTTVNTLNEELKQREKLRLEQLEAKKKGHDLDTVPEVVDEGPDWQRKMRAKAAGELAWKREQEQLAAAGHSNLRGGGYGDDFPQDEEEEEESSAGGEDTSKPKKKRQKHKNHHPANPVLDFILMMSVFTITRAVLRVCLQYRQISRMMEAQGGLVPGSTAMNMSSTTTRNNNNNNPRSSLARMMVPSSIQYGTLLQNARNRTLTQLNRQREEHGQPPLSMESLRLVLRDSDDFSANDYEALMRFHEETNAAAANTMGATQAEIEECPQRVLTSPQDDLLNHHHHRHHHHPHYHHNPQECPICLEAYKLQDKVRRIPCCHEFHVHCIDPWLSQKAVCPVCKHPVLGS